MKLSTFSYTPSEESVICISKLFVFRCHFTEDDSHFRTVDFMLFDTAIPYLNFFQSYLIFKKKKKKKTNSKAKMANPETFFFFFNIE